MSKPPEKRDITIQVERQYGNTKVRAIIHYTYDEEAIRQAEQIAVQGILENLPNIMAKRKAAAAEHTA